MLESNGVFEVVCPDKIRGRKILLVDDVMTTGATVEILCELLKKAGAKSVTVLTVASVSKELNSESKQ